MDLAERIDTGRQGRRARQVHRACYEKDRYQLQAGPMPRIRPRRHGVPVGASDRRAYQGPWEGLVMGAQEGRARGGFESERF